MSAVLKSTELIGIRSDEIDRWWPYLESFVRKPLDRTGAIKDYLPEDILGFIKNRDMQCWVAHNGQEPLAVIITEILAYPQRKVLGIVFTGAINGSIDLWLDHFRIMKDFAREHGCSVIRIRGRKGWEKVFKPDDTLVEFDIEVEA